MIKNNIVYRLVFEWYRLNLQNTMLSSEQWTTRVLLRYNVYELLFFCEKYSFVIGSQ